MIFMALMYVIFFVLPTIQVHRALNAGSYRDEPGKCLISGVTLAAGPTNYIAAWIVVPNEMKKVHTFEKKPKEIETVDEHGYRKEYDPHITRALEASMRESVGDLPPLSISELTACEDESCQTCKDSRAGTYESKLPDVKTTAYDEYKAVNELKKARDEEARIQKQLMEDEKYSKVYDADDFKPSHIPYACPVTMETGKDGNALLIWSPPGHRYDFVQRLEGYRVVYDPNTLEDRLMLIRKPERLVKNGPWKPVENKPGYYKIDGSQINADRIMTHMALNSHIFNEKAE